MFLNLFIAPLQRFFSALVLGVVDDAGADQRSPFARETDKAHFRRDDAPRAMLMQPLENGCLPGDRLVDPVACRFRRSPAVGLKCGADVRRVELRQFFIHAAIKFQCMLIGVEKFSGVAVKDYDSVVKLCRRAQPYADALWNDKSISNIRGTRNS